VYSVSCDAVSENFHQYGVFVTYFYISFKGPFKNSYGVSSIATNLYVIRQSFKKIGSKVAEKNGCEKTRREI